MSSVGKLFTVLNLVLAALFVGSAASLIGTSGHWRGQAEAKQAELVSLRATMDADKAELEDQLNQAKAQYDRLLGRVNELDADKTALDSELETERKQNADLREAFNGLDSKLGDLEQTNRNLVSRIGDLERESRTLREERDSAFDARDSALAEATAAKQEAALATGRMDDLMRQINAERDLREGAEAKLATAVRMYNIDLNTLGGGQPYVEGTILSVSYESGAPIVLINKGTRDGVKPGHTFDVFQGSTYKGRVRVEVVNESNAAATITLSSGESISRGDRFATSV